MLFRNLKYYFGLYKIIKEVEKTLPLTPPPSPSKTASQRWAKHFIHFILLRWLLRRQCTLGHVPEN